MPSVCSLHFSLSFIISLEKWSKFLLVTASSCWRAFELPLHISRRRRRCLESLSEPSSLTRTQKQGRKKFYNLFSFSSSILLRQASLDPIPRGGGLGSFIRKNLLFFHSNEQYQKKGKIEEAKVLRKKYMRETRKISKSSTKLTLFVSKAEIDTKSSRLANVAMGMKCL